MKTFVLFIFGEFEDHEDVEFFTTEILGKVPSISTLRYVIEDVKNIIVIFDSDISYQELSNDLYETLKIDHIKFYFLFIRDGLITTHLPKNLVDMVFKPSVNDKSPIVTRIVKTFDLDEILEKIDKTGIISLTPEEKNYLDNFEN